MGGREAETRESEPPDENRSCEVYGCGGSKQYWRERDERRSEEERWRSRVQGKGEGSGDGRGTEGGGGRSRREEEASRS